MIWRLLDNQWCFSFSLTTKTSKSALGGRHGKKDKRKEENKTARKWEDVTLTCLLLDRGELSRVRVWVIGLYVRVNWSTRAAGVCWMEWWCDWCWLESWNYLFKYLLSSLPIIWNDMEYSYKTFFRLFSSLTSTRSLVCPKKEIHVTAFTGKRQKRKERPVPATWTSHSSFLFPFPLFLLPPLPFILKSNRENTYRFFPSHQ
jgi:hypothetical protein